MHPSFNISNPVFIVKPQEDLQGSDIINDASEYRQGISNFPDSSLNGLQPNLLSSVLTKDVYVCTFCQVFSPHLSVVSEHISSKHGHSLPSGTTAESFVSKLQSLEGTVKKKKGKTGRPKKGQDKNKVEDFEQKHLPEEPVVGPGGLFWCKKCLRSFKKPRQLTHHICLQSEEQDSLSSDEFCVESEDDTFKPCVDVNPVPWSKRKMRGSSKVKMKFMSGDNRQDLVNNTIPVDSNVISKVAPNWRQDPSYIPLFQTESEKKAFEEHLKSIDYSSVDTLFQIEKDRCKNGNKQNYIQNKIYSCKCCKKVMKTISQIRLHCLIHTDFKPFSCPQCEYCTNSKGSLYIHMRKHTGNVFNCSFCDFKTVKRAHLLDHEATHSSVPQFCKLCKNIYKTLRSLVAHVRKYHNNAGGKKYIKSLTSKETKCNVCKKMFKTFDIFQTHNKVCHEKGQTSNDPCKSQSENHMNTSNNAPIIEDLPQSKDPLAEIILNDLLQQEQSQSVLYSAVFSETGEPVPEDVLLNFQPQTSRLPSVSSIFEECQKTLNFDILDGCLQNRKFSNDCRQEFKLSSENSLQNNSGIRSGHQLQTIAEEDSLEVIPEDKCDEAKPVEVKLFEKCQRAPAYVCCVCSRIYICPTTLKAHLKEHVNSTNSPLLDQPEEQFETSKIPEAANDLDKVCEILQNSTETCSFDEELENLYTSSLDMIWYLPEVSVVLEKDPTLCDILLDDIANFSASVGDPPDMCTKDENVLECFDEL